MLKEDRLLLGITQSSIYGEESTRFSEGEFDKIDWALFLEKSKNHSLLPLVAYGFKRFGYEKAIPSSIRAEIERNLKIAKFESLYFQYELERILDGFLQAGIETIALKGVALREVLYPNITCRPLGDIDLLIHKADLARIRKVVNRLGYVPKRGSKFQDAVERHKGRVKFVKEADGNTVGLDLHWDLVSKQMMSKIVNLNTDEVWNRAEQISIVGKRALILCPLDLFLYQAWHLSVHHKISTLIWLVDIAAIIRQYQDRINWVKLIDMVRYCGMANATYYSLFFSKKLLSAPVAVNILTELEPSSQTWFTRLWIDSILDEERILNFKNATGRGNIVENIIDNLWEILLMDNYKQKWKALLLFVFPDREFISLYYNVFSKSLRILCYLLHPVVVILMALMIIFLTISLYTKKYSLVPKHLSL